MPFFAESKKICIFQCTKVSLLSISAGRQLSVEGIKVSEPEMRAAHP